MKRLLMAFALLALSSFAMAAVNINTASKEELEALPGIGPVKAQAIIDYRKANGRFKSVEDIDKVKGIGDKTFERLKGDIAITGASSGSPKAAAPAAPTKAEPAKMAAPTAAPMKAEPAKMAAPTAPMKAEPAKMAAPTAAPTAPMKAEPAKTTASTTAAAKSESNKSSGAASAAPTRSDDKADMVAKSKDKAAMDAKSKDAKSKDEAPKK